VLLGAPTRGVKGVLQSLGQSNEALSSLDNLGVLPTAVGQAVMVNQVFEGLTLDGDSDPLEFGEVREAHQTRLMPDLEHDFWGRTVQNLPGLNPSLHGSQDLRVLTGVLALQVLEEGFGFEPRLSTQHGF